MGVANSISAVIAGAVGLGVGPPVIAVAKRRRVRSLARKITIAVEPKSEAAKTTQPISTTNDYPCVQKLLCEGWKLGDKPN
jgi:hypothetical protein